MWALLERICSPKSQGLQDQTPPPQKWETWCQRHQDFAEELSDLGWGAPLFLFGVLADPKHPEIHLPPPKNVSHLLHAAVCLFYLIPCLTSGPQCFGTASGRPRINVTPAWQWLPLHAQDDWASINTTALLCPQHSNLFYLAFGGLPQCAFLISPNLSTVKDPAQFLKILPL